MKTKTQIKAEKEFKLVLKSEQYKNFSDLQKETMNECHRLVIEALEEQAEELHYKYRFDFSKELQKELQAQKQKFEEVLDKIGFQTTQLLVLFNSKELGTKDIRNLRYSIRQFKLALNNQNHQQKALYLSAADAKAEATPETSHELVSRQVEDRGSNICESAEKILLWCEICNQKVWLRAKNISDILNEAMWHRSGFCIRKSHKHIISTMPQKFTPKKEGEKK